MSHKYVLLKEVCEKASSNIAQKDLAECDGIYPIYGASGYIKSVDFFQQAKDYIAIVKDGAGIGRAMKLPAKSSVIGTMQYVLPKDNINISYLYYAICSMHLEKYFSGATIPHIYFRDYQNEQLPLPTLEEQAKIANVFGRIDYFIKKEKEQLINLDKLVKSRFIEMFGDPITNTKRWPADKVEAVCSNIYGGGTPSKSKEEYWNGDIPWISSKDMKSDMISDSQIRITNLGLDNSSAKLVPINSVIMVIRSGILKHTLPVAINTVPVTVNQDLKVFIPSVSIHYRFLAFLFKMLEKDILAGVRAVTADNIEFDTLKNRKIILPPVQLQNQFASFVTQVDKSKLAIQQSLDELETLKKSLMQQYFG